MRSDRRDDDLVRRGFTDFMQRHPMLSLDPWSDRADPGTPGPTCRPSRDAARPSPEASHPRSSVRGQATAVEGSCDFLGVNGWKREWQNRIIGHGGRGVRG